MDTGSQRYGGHGERETPGSIPNPEAKPLSADGTAPGTGWESRTPPDIPSQTGPQPPGWGPVCIPGTSSRKSTVLDRDKVRMGSVTRGVGQVVGVSTDSADGSPEGASPARIR